MTTTVAPRATTPIRYRFTVADYYAMVNGGILAENDRVELLDGDIIDMPPIGDWHAASVNRLNNLMLPLLRQRAIMSEPIPDIMLLRWRDDFYETGHPSPDDVLLIIEVSDSTVDYDRNDKLTAYARAAIPEVWIVSRQDRRIEAYTEPTGGRYSNARYVGRGENIAPGALPDLVVGIDRVLTE